MPKRCNCLLVLTAHAFTTRPSLRCGVRRAAIPPALEADIKSYLAVRDQALRTNTTVDRGQEIREGTENNPVWQGAYYLLSLDTFLP